MDTLYDRLRAAQSAPEPEAAETTYDRLSSAWGVAREAWASGQQGLGFVGGLTRGMESEMPVLGTGRQAVDLGSVMRAAGRVEEGLPQPGDTEMLRDWAIGRERERVRSEDFGYRAGEMTGAGLGFLTEFLATGGVGPALRATAGKVLSKAATETAEAAVKRSILKKVGAAAFDVAAQAAAMEAIGQVGALGMEEGAGGRITLSTWQRVAGQVPIFAELDPQGELSMEVYGNVPEFVDTLDQGVVDTLIEVASERSGEAILKLGGSLAKLDPIDRARALYAGAIQSVMRRTGLSAAPAGALIRKAGFQGALVEMGEEFVGEAARKTAPNLEESWAEPFQTADQWAEMLLSFSLIGAGASVAQDLTGAQPPREEGSLADVVDEPGDGPPVAAPGKGVTPQEEAENGVVQPAPPAPQTPPGETERVAQEGLERARRAFPNLEFAEVPEEWREAAQEVEEAAAEGGADVRWVGGEENFRAAQVGEGVFLMGTGLLENRDAALRYRLHEQIHDIGSKGQARGEDYITPLVADLQEADPEGFEAARQSYMQDFPGELAEGLQLEEGAARRAEELGGLIEYLKTDQGGQWLEGLYRDDRSAFRKVVDWIKELVQRMGLPAATTHQKKLQALSEALGEDFALPDVQAAEILRDALSALQPAKGKIAPPSQRPTVERPGERQAEPARPYVEPLSSEDQALGDRRLGRQPQEPVSAEPEAPFVEVDTSGMTPAQARRARKRAARARRRQLDTQEARRQARGQERREAPETRAERAARMFDEGVEDPARFAVPRKTDTPAFKRWFGDSKVVDENGEPLVVYHGTFSPERFTRFKGSGPFQEFYFSGAPGAASQYAERHPVLEADAASRPRVFPAFLSIANPLRLNPGEWLQGPLDPDQAQARGYDGYFIRAEPLHPEPTFREPVYVAFRPEQIKSAIGNTGAFDPANPDIRYAVPRQDQLGFYSAVEKAALDSPQKKYVRGQVRPRLKKYGAKDEELDWMGLDEWLASLPKGEKITSDELLEFIRENAVVVGERVLGVPPDPVQFERSAVWEQRHRIMSDMQANLDALGAEIGSELLRYNAQQVDRREDEMRAHSPEADRLVSRHFALKAEMVETQEALEQLPPAPESGGDARHSEYQEPGGSNYRELLLTLPGQGLTEADRAEIQKLNESALRAEGRGAQGVADGYRREIETIRRSAKAFSSEPHFSDPNILAWVRFNERTDAEGARVLFIEEIQSDWGQQGRKEGYAGHPTGRWEVVKTYADGYVNKEAFDTKAQAEARAESLNFAPGPFTATVQEQVSERGVPPGPFIGGPSPGGKDHGQSWPTLALRRMVRYAAELGFDKIAWTTGAMQVSRYEDSFRKAVDSIEWNRVNDKMLYVWATKGGSKVWHSSFDGRGVHNEGADGKTLEDFVGKEIARRALTEDSGKVEGEGLTIGGKGFTEFYDKRLVSTANKLGKKFGAKVGRTDVWTLPPKVVPAGRAPGESISVPSLPITEAMRESVTEYGQPRFAVPRRPRNRFRELQAAREYAGELEQLHNLRDLASQDAIEGRPDLAQTGSAPPVQDVQVAVDEMRNMAGIPEARDLLKAQKLAGFRVSARFEETYREILDKIRNGQPLSDEETFALRDITGRVSTLALRTGDELAWLEALRANWKYRQSGSDASAAFRARQSRFNRETHSQELVALLLARPTLRTDRALQKLISERSKPTTSEDRRLEIDGQVEALLRQEAKKTPRVYAALRRHGIDPTSLTASSFADPYEATKLIRIIGPARAGQADKWREFLYASMLSHPFTQFRNIGGNVLNVTVGKHTQEILEGLVNTVVKDPDSPSLEETRFLLEEGWEALRAGGRRFLRAYQVEPLAEGLDQVQANKLAEGVGAPAIGKDSFAGKLYHYGLKWYSLDLLRAADEFFKGYIEHLASRQFAFRAARAEGVKGAEATRRRMGELMLDPALQERVLDQAIHLTFQDKADPNTILGQLDITARGLREKMDNVFPAFPFTGTLLMPFVKTPLRIYREGIRRSPLAPGLYTAKALAHFLAGRKLGKTEQVRAAADSILALGIFAAVLGLIEYIEDDDEPIIGGTREDFTDRAASGLQRAVMPAYSLRVGDTILNFKQREPVAQAVAMAVDMARGLKEGGVVESAEEGVTAGARNFLDQSYMQAASDFMALVKRRKHAGEYSFDRYVTPWMPNIIRGTFRESNENLPEYAVRRQWDDIGNEAPLAKHIAHRLTNHSAIAPPPKVDVWGREVKRTPVGLLNGIVLERNISSGEATKGDRLLWNWSQKVKRGEADGQDPKPYYPSLPEPFYTRNRERMYWTEEQYEDLTRTSGQLLYDLVESANLNVDDPGEVDVEAVKKLRRAAVARAKREVLSRSN